MPHNITAIDIHTRKKLIERKRAKQSNRAIATALGISKSSVKRFWRERNLDNIGSKIPDRSGSNNPNAKMTKEYEETVLQLLENQNDMYNHEVSNEAKNITNISLSSNQVERIFKRLGVKSRLKSVLYTTTQMEKYQQQSDCFIKKHNSYDGEVKLNQYMSTDEAGFKGNIWHKHGKSITQKSKIQKKIPGRALLWLTAGGSYKSNCSRLYGITSKHTNFKFNPILTISLHARYPVVHYEIHDQYINGGSYAEFIYNRRDVSGVKYDIIDKASFHYSLQPAGNACSSVTDAYTEMQINKDFVPTGFHCYDHKQNLQ